MRVLTYNVCYSDADEFQGGRHWDGRRDAVARTIAFHDPAVACLQECWQGQTADLQDRLPGYEWAGEDHGVGWHTPIAYDPDRLTLRDWRTFWLAPDHTDRTAAWDAAYPRLVTQAIFAQFDCYSVHLDHEGPQARVESARLLADRIRDRDRPAVVAGDLNCERGSEPHAALETVSTDAGADTAHGPRGTYNGYEGVAGLREERALDHVYVRGLEPRGFGVCTDIDGDCRFPSDHCPVRATVGRPAGGQGRG